MRLNDFSECGSGCHQFSSSEAMIGMMVKVVVAKIVMIMVANENE